VSDTDWCQAKSVPTPCDFAAATDMAGAARWDADQWMKPFEVVMLRRRPQRTSNGNGPCRDRAYDLGIKSG